ncbi:hypothetical protein FZI85_12740 [Mycobacterium sp. CBMA293]|uniref:hypothetical protein n=1 Tax=unclassified Mycolicibacterium TaxID=2636767 RepID=UPI0012DE7121|nr:MULTISPECIES: hypothetical protein [unclassified Mycolicibacterium]MUL47417.1 hypothetical protein [Mycolicibacterium sp. CBMA 360]MUL59402.1 hypothetical protein [Mycolicibacterium sp. CBMA 335]MUL71127.1 hypothetical protein [Mycolicibacterium sp. CBMA 311]MUL94770.1 hypothetical protein [Mycolicibacterium sp. CBMA 230]MUM11890.1 hypothetical protein [Mycolicibacterium sp. CBMA 293]
MGGLAVTLASAVMITRRDRNPLFLLLLVSGALLFPFFVEPAGDIILATWYPADTPAIAATILGRHIPWFVVIGYTAGIPTACYVGYRMIIAGMAVKRILLALAVISLSEGVIEMTAVHFGFMSYYGNHALVFGVPLSTLVQNAGMFVLIGVALAGLVPRLRGWTWVAIPFVPPMVFMAYVVACTMPSFYAIHGQFAPIPFWIAAAVSTALNGGVAVAALYTGIAKSYRAGTATASVRNPLISNAVPTAQV